MELMETLDHQRKILALILVKETQNLAWVCIIILIMFFANGKEILTSSTQWVWCFSQL